jgi:hypothetical protein
MLGYLPLILAFGIPAAFVLLMSFVVPRRITMRMLDVKDRMDRSADRVFGAVAFWGALLAYFVVGFIVLRAFPVLEWIIVITSVFGACVRLARWFAPFRKAAEDYSASVHQRLP